MRTQLNTKSSSQIRKLNNKVEEKICAVIETGIILVIIVVADAEQVAVVDVQTHL